MHASTFYSRQLAARALVIALLPAAPVLFLATRSLTLAGAALALFVVTFALVTGWLFPRYRRIDAVLELLPTIASMGVGALAALIVTITTPCGSGEDRCHPPRHARRARGLRRARPDLRGRLELGAWPR